MKTVSVVSLLLAALALTAGSICAEGFGTPALDGLYDVVYNTAEASDPSGDGNGNAVMDLLDLYVCNDNTFWYVYATINADIGATNWGKYRFYIDTTNDTVGGTSDPWGRNVIVSETHEPEYSFATWVNNPPYGTEDTQFWVWDQGTLAWSQSGSLDGAALSAAAVSGIEWKIARSRIGDPDTVWVEVWSTGGGDTDNAQDTSNDPADDWNAVDWSSQATLMNSTKVAVVAGGDVTPPTLDDATIVENVTDELLVTFSEPLDPVTAENASNYTVTGVNVTTAQLQTDSSKVLLILGEVMGLGACLSVEAVNVEDRAGNAIHDNNDTNVYDFYMTELTVNAQMRLYLRANSAAPDPDTIDIEGGIAPLSWDPTCDDLMTGPDVDSVFTGTNTFLHYCTGGVTDTLTIEYKFTHQCVTWESSGNHIYELNGSAARDTVNIWWNDEAPVDFTDKDIDVLFFVMSSLADPWDGAVDTIGVNGSELPLEWNDTLATNLLADDGVLPDSTAGDGIFSGRLTFPTGTRKSVDFKYLWKGEADTLFNYECFLQSNRNVFLNDTLFSTTTPIVMDLAFWNICGDPVGVDGGDLPASTSFELLHNVPNPFNPSTAIEFNLPERAAVDLSVFDVSGRLVRVLLDADLPAGAYTGGRAVRWDGTNGAGREAPSGVYFYRLKAGSKEMTKKMVLVR